MIDKSIILKQIEGQEALWCGAGMEGGDLARAVEVLETKSMRLVSVVPDSVMTIWPWLERTDVKIFARFYFPDKRISEKQVSDVTVRINDSFKRGAHGAQVFLPYVALNSLVEQTHVIRDDLFFDKDLIIGIDICDVEADDWNDLFMNLRKINANAVMFVFTNDMGEKSDFVGRIYGMLNSWSADNNFDLHFAFGPNFMRIEQALRLVQSVKPQLNKRLKFWLNY